MAVKLVVLALAVCSASANICLPYFPTQDNSQVSIPEVFQASAPQPAIISAPKYVSAAPVISAAPVVASSPVVNAAPVLTLSAPSFGSGSDFSDSGVEFATTSNGPSPSSSNLPVLQAPPVTLNPVESPIIRLPSPPVPGPKVIRHKCFCTKTVVRPQVIQRTITVPRIQRYLKQSYRPIVENVSYQAKPVGSDSQSDDIVIGGSSSSGQFSAPVFVSNGLSGAVSSGLSGFSGLTSGSFPDSDSFDAQSREPVVQVVPRCY